MASFAHKARRARYHATLKTFRVNTRKGVLALLRENGCTCQPTIIPTLIEDRLPVVEHHGDCPVPNLGSIGKHPTLEEIRDAGAEE
jgi:hypothetical protein